MNGGRLAFAIARSRNGDVNAPIGLENLRRFEAQGLAIVHGPEPADAARPEPALIQEFASTVDALHRRETVLPLRYGCIVASESAFETLIVRHREEWLETLEIVDGCDEMGLRVILEPSPVSANINGSLPEIEGRPGTSYLAALRQRLASAEALGQEAARISDLIQQALKPEFRRLAVEKPAPGRDRLLSLAFLVPRPDLNGFRAAVKRLESQVSGKLLLTGPWPPFSFSALPLRDGNA